MKVLYKTISLVSDFLFPKDTGLLKFEHMPLGELITQFPQAQEIKHSGFALWKYSEKDVRQFIWYIKYSNNQILLSKAGLILLDHIQEELLEKNPLDTNREKPILSYTPMHTRRLMERGWNPAEEIAEAVHKHDSSNSLIYKPHILEKKFYTDSQTHTTSKSQRLENIKNSMMASESSVEGKVVVIVDDVYTTGATATEINRALKEAGAKEIIFVALAH